MYRAVNTTDRNRGNCCGSEPGSVAPSADLHVTSLWWTGNLSVHGEATSQRSPSLCRTLEHHQRCRVTNTRLLVYFFSLRLHHTLEFEFTRGWKHRWCTKTSSLRTEKCIPKTRISIQIIHAAVSSKPPHLDMLEMVKSATLELPFYFLSTLEGLKSC